MRVTIGIPLGRLPPLTVATVNPVQTPKASNAAEAEQRKQPRQKQDEFDKTVRELIFEAKGTATDRLKTPEEKARNEFERLQKLENARCGTSPLFGVIGFGCASARNQPPHVTCIL